MNRQALVILAFGISVPWRVALAATVEPAPKTYVEDRAGVIEAATKQQLIGLLQELEQKTNARVIVLTVNSTGGQDIHQFAFERADQWKFGPNRKSASVLITVAVGDRKYWTEVGYDWEGVLTDGFVGQVGRTYLVPNFRQGNYNQGILQAIAALAQEIGREAGVTLTGMPRLPALGRRGRPAWPCGTFLPLLLLIGLLAGRRHRGLLFWGLLGGMMLGGRGGFGRGGFGGGGFGSFGGGGGGGFGGGGAGGSW